MVVKWTFFDPLVPETYTFEINPREGGTPPRKKSITYQNTSAPDGKTLIFQGQDDVQSFQISGVIRTEEQLDAFDYWFAKDHQILMTDDLERAYWVLITGFTPQRERAANAPWKHTYSMDITILDWPE